ncbi:hypothetical protein [Mucilaginibacter psychrotolerans]|uniref:Uncharacterized protein n=1 Tax=Mucilaginibacter psychrotolerans TaxID=1524096 RepID=A0A4Y8SQ64_9SPHI|nr:hypothetical protein [Mucilaginibacter psychrotolerans]TFF40815.1 hypothetical protein E2R66_01150 [Mucilaginibacter psychrotolerans]
MEFSESRYQHTGTLGFMYDRLFLQGPIEEDDEVLEGDWYDEEDEDFDDQVEDRDEMHQIRVGDDVREPDPEDDDHLPDDDLQ